MILAQLAVASCSLALAGAGPLDSDFAAQGEYAGFVADAPGVSRRTGLQVVARGSDEFIAVEYPGGLPGNGGSMNNRRKYTGARMAAGIDFTTDGRRIEIRGRAAVVRDGQGLELGLLRKFHRLSRTLGAPPPCGAIVLFNGTNTDRFTNGSLTADGGLNVGADTREAFGDFTLHLEFRTPFLPEARDQGRANSGVYLQGRYEVQILDSFGLDGLNNECGGLYKTQPPIVNMCFPPLSWQTYDIDFTAARFDAGWIKTSPARMTVRHNGIVVHKDFAIPNKTGAGAAEGPDPRPIRLQAHGNPVHFRNIWIVERRPAIQSIGPSSGSWMDPCRCRGDLTFTAPSAAAINFPTCACP
ncbi:MAG: DUF1080 domain-containing protein [Planctomycetaceae bacterium]|nr:DUF1080 domain-containing protein [Planctomycetaceae bacterium]